MMAEVEKERDGRHARDNVISAEIVITGAPKSVIDALKKSGASFAISFNGQ